MKLHLYFIVFSISIFSCKSQTARSRIKIVQPTIEQEATSIWRTINDITFFEKQGYQIYLPNDPLIDTLISKSKKGTFGNKDYPAIQTLVRTKVFTQKNYVHAIQKVSKEITLLNKLINEIEDKKGDWDWKFKTFDKYKVVFTLFGTGGSYDPDEGVITLLTNKEGGFMKYENPANTIIHEITHMGMEFSIVRKYNLPHGSKERLVDTFVYLMFRDELPDYQIQPMGNEHFDIHLKKPNDIESLDEFISNLIRN